MTTPTIIPTRITVPVQHEVDGQLQTTDITIRPFSFGQIPAVTRHIASIASGLTIDEVSIPSLIATGGEDILSVLSIATGKPRAWFDTVEPESGVALVSAVINANREVFVKKLLPALQEMAKAVTGKTAA